MRMQRYNGLLVLALLQSVPVGTYTDDDGRTRVGFGFGFGQFERVSAVWGFSDCSGERIRESEVVRASPVMAGGVDVQTWAAPNVRLHGFASGISADSLGWRGVATGGIASYEQRTWGVGLGGAITPGVPAVTAQGGSAAGSSGSGSLGIIPAGQARFGTLDGVHTRIDFGVPSPAFGMSGLARWGVGYNQGARRGAGGFAGLSLCHYCEGSEEEDPILAGFAELAVPVTRRFDLDARVLYGPGQAHAVWGVAFGARTYVGPRAGTTP